MFAPLTAVVFVALAAPCSEALAAAETLRVGATLTRELPRWTGDADDPGPTLTFELLASGALTLTVESLDFDPTLTLADERGTIVGQDLDSGVSLNCWLVVELTPGTKYALTVASASRGHGEFTLSARDGRHEPPSGAAGERATLAYYTRVAERAESRDDFARAARFRWIAGASHYYRNELAAARPALEQLLANLTQFEDAQLQASGTAFLGAIARRERRFEDALPLLENAQKLLVPLARADLGCFVLDNLGYLYVERAGPADLEQALGCFERFAALAKASGDVAQRSLAVARIATAHEGLGDVDAAREAYREAVELTASYPQPNAHYSSQVHLWAGRFHARRSEYESALPLLALARDTAPPSALDTRAIALGQLATCFIATARFGDARSCIREIRALDERSSTSPLDAQDHVVLARLLWQLGEPEEAERHLTASLAALEHPWDWRTRAKVLQNLGLLAVSRGDTTSALEHLGAALELYRDRPGATDRRWSLHVNLGRAFNVAGSFGEARGHYETALGLVRPLSDALGEAQVRAGLGYSLVRLGELATAQEHSRAALETFATLDEQWESLRPLHNLARVDLAEGALDAAHERLRSAHAIVDSQQARSLDPAHAAGLRSRVTYWSEVAQDLTAARAAALEREGLDPLVPIVNGLAEAARWKGRSLLEGIRPPADAAADPVPAPQALLGDLQRVLGDGRVLIEYAAGQDSLYAYVVDAAGVRFVDLGSKEELESLVAAYLVGVSDVARLANAESIARDGHALHRRLVAPLVDGRADPVEAIVFVPTAWLAGFPFEALVCADAPEAPVVSGFEQIAFLSDRFGITYSPSTTVLIELAARPPRAGDERVLLVGDPVFASEVADGAPAGTPGSLLALERLPRTRKEVLGVARTILVAGDESDAFSALGQLESESASARDGEVHSRLFDLFLGRAASVERVFERASSYSIVHVASHGHVDRSDPRRTGIVLAYDEAGLGLLSLRDVVDLELDADLAVLSACETARGRVVKGEGVHSMAKAFIQAGARAVVASLWLVHDVETELTMRSLYDALLREGASPSEALRRAKEHLRGARIGRGVPAVDGSTRVAGSGHPYFWAPFIYIGRVD